MSKYAVTTATGAALLLTACASTPDVMYQYYPSRSSLLVVATETFTCATDNNQVVVGLNPAPTITLSYAADHSQQPLSVPAKGFDGPFSDTDINVTLFDDGRLKSVSTSYTGEGETVIKSAVGLLGALGGGTSAAVNKAAAATGACAIVKKMNSSGSIAFNFNQTIVPEKHVGEILDLVPIANAAGYATIVRTDPALAMTISISNERVVVPPVIPVRGADLSSTVGLQLQETADVQVDLKAANRAVFEGTFMIPVPGKIYSVPIPKAAAFGAGKFSLTLNDAGAVTAIDYNKTSGASQVLDTGTAIAPTIIKAPAPPSNPSSPPGIPSPPPSQ